MTSQVIKGFLVLEHCPAPTHNTLYAAKSRILATGRKPRCICPHALALYEEYKIRQRESSKTAGCGERQKELRGPYAVQPNERTARIPFNYTGGLCTTPEGREIADKGFNSFASKIGIKDRQEAKDQCHRCPLEVGCLQNAIAEEVPAGAWGGVYGGEDAWERRGKQTVYQDGRVRVIDREI